uniref:Uncharacterized protein n=1 Tax=Oryza nivara TaxID=4536 RepID=A0A0E0IKI6_ORYNI
MALKRETARLGSCLRRRRVLAADAVRGDSPAVVVRTRKRARPRQWLRTALLSTTLVPRQPPATPALLPAASKETERSSTESSVASGLDFEDTILTLCLPCSLAVAVPDPDHKRSSSKADTADNSSPLATSGYDQRLSHCGRCRQGDADGAADAGLPAPRRHRLGDADAGLPALPPCFPTTAAAANRAMPTPASPRLAATDWATPTPASPRLCRASQLRPLRRQGDIDAGLPAPRRHRLGDADAGLPAPRRHHLGDIDACLPALPPCFPTTAAAVAVAVLPSSSLVALASLQISERERDE